ncbi:MAG: hypothetical protein R3264_03715, partial [Anaerolineae bacterium]|nr:hypothetical protein [Anaerolineae bacterium]
MATATKSKNGNVAAEAIADATAAATKETQAAVDSILEAAYKATENGRSLLNAQQKMFKEGFEFWQKYNKTTLDFSVEATRKSFE